MKTFLKNIIYTFASFFSFSGAVILMYHSIDENKEFFTVKPKDFEKQMAYLKKNNFNVISLEKLSTYLKKNISIPPKTICITFDDGYRDNYKNAFPVLKRHGFPATIFVISSKIDDKVTARRGTVLEMLSMQDIRVMAEEGVDFGAHTHSHQVFSPKLEKEKIERELIESRDIIKNIIGNNINSFAYPKGAYDARSEELARKYFKIICTVKKGRVFQKTKPWSLPRVSIDSRVSQSQFRGMIKVGRI